MARRPLPLRLETLEDRITPTTYNFPWADARHLTISFVPDGTAVGQNTSTLFQTLDAQAPRAVWQHEVLRGLQTWAANANINLTVVSDDGEPLGAAGAPQGDSRFGDVRIALAPLSSGLGATSVPFGLEAGTWAGDIVFNQNFTFNQGGTNGALDIFSVAVHEAGHVFGLPDVTDTSSPMYVAYNGVRTGLNATDVANIQTLYGKRASDAFEGLFGNNARTSAVDFYNSAQYQLNADLASFEKAADVTGLVPFSVEGDLTTATDVDYYAFRTPSDLTGFTVNLTTPGESLLTAKLTVQDSAGNPVGSQAAADPQSGNLSLQVSGAKASSLYYLKVEQANGDAFGIGSYRLQIAPTSPSLQNAIAASVSNFEAAMTNNDTRTAATVLSPVRGGSAAHREYVYRGVLDRATDVDWYRFQAPNTATDDGSSTQTATVTVWSLDPAGVVPAVNLYNGTGTLLAPSSTTVGAALKLQLPGVAGGAQLYAAVQGTTPGRYFLSIEFNAPEEATPVVAGGTLNAGLQQDFRSVTLPQTTLLHLEIGIDAPNAVVETAVEVTLFNGQGQAVLDQVLKAGQTWALDQELAPDSYTLRFVAGTIDNSTLSNVNYSVKAAVLNAPIAPPLSDPTNPPPIDILPIWFQYGITTILQILDPYGHPINTSGGTSSSGSTSSSGTSGTIH